MGEALKEHARMCREFDNPKGLQKASSGHPKTISKLAFELLVFIGLAVLTFGEIVVLQSMGRACGFRVESYWVGGSTMLNMILIRVTVDSLLKRLGLSRSGRTLEVQGKTMPVHERLDEEFVEVRYSRSFFAGLALMCLTVCVAISMMLATSPPARIKGFGAACTIACLFGLGAAWCFYEILFGKPRATADESRITGHPVGPHLRYRFVPWSEVATCEIETLYDTFGKPVLIRPTLRDFDGEVLMTLMLNFSKMQDQERLVKFIKAKLPKTKNEFWE